MAFYYLNLIICENCTAIKYTYWENINKFIKFANCQKKY